LSLLDPLGFLRLVSAHRAARTISSAVELHAVYVPPAGSGKVDAGHRYCTANLAFNPHERQSDPYTPAKRTTFDGLNVQAIYMLHLKLYQFIGENGLKLPMT
jgi:hypothetical protein